MYHWRPKSWLLWLGVVGNYQTFYKFRQVTERVDMGSGSDELKQDIGVEHYLGIHVVKWADTVISNRSL